MSENDQEGAGSDSTPPPTPIRLAWLDFTYCVKHALLKPQDDDRPLDQYLEYRDKVFALVQNESFLAELDKSWPVFTDYPMVGVGEALLMELNSFPRAVDVAEITESTGKPSKGWHKKWLSRASTVTGSVKDILDSLPDWAKNTITLFNELIDLFKSNH